MRKLVERKRLFTRKNANVRHPDHGQAIPALGAQSAPRSSRSNGVRGLARTEIAGEQSVRDDWSALRRDALMLERWFADHRATIVEFKLDTADPDIRRLLGLEGDMGKALGRFTGLVFQGGWNRQPVSSGQK